MEETVFVEREKISPDQEHPFKPPNLFSLFPKKVQRFLQGNA